DSSGNVDFSWSGPDAFTTGQQDVYETDYTVGSTWAYTAPAAPSWAGRYFDGATSAGGKMWISGGYDGTTMYADVWSSANGSNWTQAAGTGATGGNNPFTARSEQTTYAFDNRMFVVAGYGTLTADNDVWSSVDGINWNQTAATPFGFGANGRGAFAST